jgi:hypothetical protein
MRWAHRLSRRSLRRDPERPPWFVEYLASPRCPKVIEAARSAYRLIRLGAREMVENKMPRPAKNQLLLEISDIIEAAVLSGCTPSGAKNSLFIARSTWNELRELIFQVHDPKIADAALQELLDSRIWSRAWEYRMHSDPQWKESAYVFALLPMNPGNNV